MVLEVVLGRLVPYINGQIYTGVEWTLKLVPGKGSSVIDVTTAITTPDPVGDWKPTERAVDVLKRKSRGLDEHTAFIHPREA